MKEYDETDFLAHEVKNSITLITAAARLLKEDDENKEKSLDIIVREAKKIHTNVDLMQGKIKVIQTQKEKLIITDIIEGINDDFESLYKKKGLNQRIKILGSEKFIFQNRHEINETISNIIKNAIESSFENKTVEITVLYKENFIEVKVKNYGDPIPEELKEQIGTKYFTTKENGNGIGVYYCKNILENAGGKLVFSNNDEGDGVTVKILIPTAD